MQQVKALDDPTDELGYHGKTKWNREKIHGKLAECSINEFTKIIHRNPDKLQDIIFTIR